MAYTTVHAPRGMPSDMGKMSNTKKRLVDAMEEFRKEGDRVNPTEEQVALAEQLAMECDPTRYTKIHFETIVQKNSVRRMLYASCSNWFVFFYLQKSTMWYIFP